MPSQDPQPSNGAEDEEEEDYMKMTIEEPTKSKEKETYTQRRIRKQRESEARGRTKSKAELATEEAAAREAALSKSLLRLQRHCLVGSLAQRGISEYLKP